LVTYVYWVMARFGPSVVGLLVASLVAAQPAPGETILASRSPDGTKANGDTSGGALSRSGALILLRSTATNLHPLVATAIEAQLYRKDLRTGEVVLISVTPDGKLGQGVSGGYMTANGRWVVFTASKLLAEDNTRDKSDVYIRDMLTGEVKLVSKTADGIQQNGYSSYASVTPDGRHVAFVSSATNLDAAVPYSNQGHLYVKDLHTGALVLADRTASGKVNGGYVFSPVLNEDGTRVAFLTSANMSPLDSGANWDAYLKDLTDGSIRLISTNAAGAKQNREVQGLGATPDLRFVAFSSNANNLVSNDKNGRYDAFIKDTRTGEVRLISTATDGTQGDLRSFGAGLSEDGRFASFWSDSSNLVEDDTNGVADTFVRDLLTGECQRINVSTTADQTANFPSYGGISWNGAFASFNTRANLPGLSSPHYKTYVRNTGMVSGEPTLLSTLATDLYIGKNITLTTRLQDKGARLNLAGKTIMFMVDSSILGTALSNQYGVAKFPWVVPESLPLGNHQFFASFAGTVDHARGDSEITVVANPGPVSLSVPNKQKPRGQTVVLAATLKNASGAALPGRTIEFCINGDSVGTATTDAAGLAKVEYQIPSTMSVGSHETKAVFAGDVTHTSKTSIATLTVT
jgi:Tol biopolymer transport system component